MSFIRFLSVSLFECLAWSTAPGSGLLNGKKPLGLPWWLPASFDSSINYEELHLLLAKWPSTQRSSICYAAVELLLSVVYSLRPNCPSITSLGTFCRADTLASSNLVISSHLITLRPDSPLQALHPHFLPRPLIDPDAIKLFIHNYNNWRWCRRARCIDRPPAQGTQSHRLREHQHSSDARRQSPDTTQCCTRSELLWSLGEIQRGRNNSEGEYDV